MDRIIFQPAQVLQDTDLGNIQRNTMIALGYLAQATFGTGTIVDGLSLSATSPASMTVNVGQGAIFDLSTIDATAFGSLASDSDPLLKMGINAIGATSFTLTAPGTSGQSINYLIEATMQETDTNSVVLPYYNPSNPSQPYSGPSNSGAAQNTLRAQKVELQLKAGVAANTGTQLTPAVDAGYVGLYVVTVNYGQSTVTSSSWTLHPAAPFLLTKLPQMRRRLAANLTLYVNGTSGNDLNNGLSSSTAFATLQAAANYIVQGLDLQGYIVTVNVADGNYAGVTVSGNPVGYTGPGSVVFQGDTGTPDNCTVTATAAGASCFFATGGAQFSVAGFKLVSSGSNGWGLNASGAGSSITVIGNMDMASCAGSDMVASNFGLINVASAYTISGTSGSAWRVFQSGSMTCTSSVVTLSGTPSFTIAFAVADGPSEIDLASSLSFSGSATGTRYAVTNGAYLATGTANTSFLPGNAAGSSSTGYYT